MKPDAPTVLSDLARVVATNMAPDVQPADRAGALGITAALLGLAAQVFDSAAHNLVQENRAIRALLGQGAAIYPAGAALATCDEQDLRVSVLSAENAALRAALIALHRETEGRPEAEALNRAIWAELVASTERRLVAGSPA